MSFPTTLLENLGAVTSFVLSIGAVAMVWAKARTVLTQTGELIAVVVDAMADNSLTASEVKEIIKEGGDVVSALKMALAATKE